LLFDITLLQKILYLSFPLNPFLHSFS